MKEGLKQRLVGAFILVALAVIFLPGFFKEQQGHKVNTTTLIPPPPQVEVVEFVPPQNTVEVEPAPNPETMFLPEEETIPAEETAAPVPEFAQEDLAPVPELPLNDKGIPAAWVVQVVSLSNKDAAIKLRDELQSDGHKAYIREVTTANGVFNRVFIGPKLDRTEAMAIKAQMDERFKVSAQVRPFEP